MDLISDTYKSYKQAEAWANSKGYGKQFDQYVKPHPGKILQGIYNAAKSMSGMKTPRKKKPSRESSVTPNPKRSGGDRMDEDHKTDVDHPRRTSFKSTGVMKTGASQYRQVSKSGKKRKRSGKKSELTKIKKKLKKIAKEVKITPKAKFDYKTGVSGNCSHVTGAVGYTEIFICDRTRIEQMMTAIPRTTPGATGVDPTETTSDYTRGALPSKYYIQYNANVTFRNNYLFPCKVTCYELRAKVDTSDAPATCAIDGEGITSGDRNNWHNYPSESPKFNRFFKIVKKMECVLSPGDQMVHYLSGKVTYDFKDHDDQAFDYLKKYYHGLMIRTSGVPCHDNTDNTQVNMTEGKIDYVGRREFTVSYTDSSATRAQYNAEGLGSITTPVVSNGGAEKETSNTG